MHRTAALRVLRAEFLRYAAVGGLAFAADFALLALLTYVVGINYLLASLLSFVLGTLVNYQLSVRWVFGYRSSASRGSEFSFFVLIGVVTLGSGLALMTIFVGAFGLPVLVAKCLVTTFTLFANFAIRRALLFTRWARPVAADGAVRL